MTATSKAPASSGMSQSCEGVRQLLATLEARLDEEQIPVQPVELNPLVASVSRFPWPAGVQKVRAQDDCEILECYLRLGDLPNARRSLVTLRRRLDRAMTAGQGIVAGSIPTSARSNATELEALAV